jgi:hypothetical protein
MAPGDRVPPLPPAAAQLDEAFSAVSARSQRVSALEWPGARSGLDQPGLYAWWVDAGGARDLSCGRRLSLPEGLLYVGQAGAHSSVLGASSAATLRTRIGGNHLTGKVRRSTLRCTLAALLLGPAPLTVTGPRRLDPDSEARLSAWMRAHLSITVWPAPSGAQLAETEKHAVQALQAPLNLEHLEADALRRQVRRLRAIVIHGIDDLWVAPDPALREWRSILAEYGQVFDGYRYAALVRRRECAEVAEEVWRSFEEEGCVTSSFADLRCALFWLQRCVHDAEQSPGWHAGAALEDRVQRLYGVIQGAWRRERGAEA